MLGECAQEQHLRLLLPQCCLHLDAPCLPFQGHATSACAAADVRHLAHEEGAVNQRGRAGLQGQQQEKAKVKSRLWCSLYVWQQAAMQLLQRL